MDFLLKRAKTIRNFGIANLVLVITFIIWTIVFYWNSIFVENNTNNIFFILFIIILLGLIITFIGTFACSILILSTNWKDEELASSNIVWGILGLILIPTIATLCFGVKACRILSQRVQNTSNNVYNATPVNSEQLKGTEEKKSSTNIDDATW